MTKEKNNTYLYIGLAAAVLLLFNKKNNGVDRINGADENPYFKVLKTETAVLNNLKKLIECRYRVYVYYNWDDRTYTVSTVILEEKPRFRRIQFVYPGSHWMDLLKPYHIDNWRKLEEEKIYK